jgi:two-component sensor histidine kinase
MKPLPIVRPWEGVLPAQARGAVVPAAAFWLAWGLACAALHRNAWLVLSAQLWIAYSAVWLALLAFAHVTRGRSAGLGAMGATAVVAALLGELLAQPVAADFQPSRLAVLDTWTRGALLPLFALGMQVPGIVLRRREQRRHAARLERARQSAALAELARQVTEAELKTLQAQVEPHFLYNTLASVQYLVRHDPRRADAMLTHLHDYLRNALPAMRAPQSTLRREFALARAYLGVIQLRLGERLVVDVELPDALAEAAFPPLMLATLVENAVKHGAEPSPAPVRIAVRAVQAGGVLEASVVDDGCGLGAGPAAPGSGIGLANVAQRLATLHGDAASLVVEAASPRGVRAAIRIPFS